MFLFRSSLSPCLQARLLDPQGGSSVFIFKQFLNSAILLSSRIHSRHVILDPINILSLSPVSSRNSVVRSFISFVRSTSSLTVGYTISMKRCWLYINVPGPLSCGERLCKDAGVGSRGRDIQVKERLL